MSMANFDLRGVDEGEAGKLGDERARVSTKNTCMDSGD